MGHWIYSDLPSLSNREHIASLTCLHHTLIHSTWSDAEDREKLKTSLSTFIDPLDPSSHLDGVMNIANGLVSPNNVNADKSLEIRIQQMKDFEVGWPASFHGTLKRNVVAVFASKKAIKIDDALVYDTELIYTRVIGLQQSCDLSIKYVLASELSVAPPALFDENGDM